jgi:LPXTG-motif cell wall-anchored protein
MPGRSYTVSGTLVDKSTGKNLMIGGSEVTAEKTFTPEEKDGIVEISFEFDCSSLTGKSVVAYEFLYRDGIMIAGHADINDEAQTVTIGKKPTPTPTVTPIPPTKVPGRPSTPSTPGTTTRSAPVRTGDTTNILLPVILLGVSAAVIAALLIRRKKKA